MKVSHAIVCIAIGIWIAYTYPDWSAQAFQYIDAIYVWLKPPSENYLPEHPHEAAYLLFQSITGCRLCFLKTGAGRPVEGKPVVSKCQCVLKCHESDLLGLFP